MAKSNPSTSGQVVDGILILDKPGGMTSNQALQRVKRLLQVRKAGHCGSLDPMATGILPICLGQATRFSGYLLEADKTYLAKCRLGQTTSTADAEGSLVEQSEVCVDRSQIEEALVNFRGNIKANDCISLRGPDRKSSANRDLSPSTSWNCGRSTSPVTRSNSKSVAPRVLTFEVWPRISVTHSVAEHI